MEQPAHGRHSPATAFVPLRLGGSNLPSEAEVWSQRRFLSGIGGRPAPVEARPAVILGPPVVTTPPTFWPPGNEIFLVIDESSQR